MVALFIKKAPVASYTSDVLARCLEGQGLYIGYAINFYDAASA
jgi:hypothetical protein